MDNTRRFPLILSSFWLKVIALLTMTIDHVGYMLEGYAGFETTAAVFRHIGRLALPLFCFMIAEGAMHTKNFKKYALRLGIMASLISLGMLLYESIPAINQGVTIRDQGIIFIDLLLGATAVFCLRQKKWYFKLLAILPLAFGIISFFVSSYESCRCHGDVLWFPYFIRTQYGWFAILLCILFYVARLLADLYIGLLSSQSGVDRENYKDSNIERHAINIISVLMLAASSVLYYYISNLMGPDVFTAKMIKIQLFAMFSGAFILLYNGRRGYNKKWFQYGSYLYYPIHLGIIFLIFELI